MEGVKIKDGIEAVLGIGFRLRLHFGIEAVLGIGFRLRLHFGITGNTPRIFRTFIRHGTRKPSIHTSNGAIQWRTRIYKSSASSITHTRLAGCAINTVSTVLCDWRNHRIDTADAAAEYKKQCAG
jgi:hypothetical protein